MKKEKLHRCDITKFQNNSQLCGQEGKDRIPHKRNGMPQVTKMSVCIPVSN